MMTPYYDKNNIKIYCGDNVTVTREAIKTASIDLTVTSPPYDNLRDYNGYTWDFEALAAELWRVTKPGGVVVWVVGDATIDGSETGTSFRQALGFMAAGFRLHDTMIWQSSGVGAKGSNKAYWQAFEYMFVFAKGDIKTINRIADKINKNPGHLQTPSVKSISRKSNYRTVNDICIRTNVWEYDTISVRWDVKSNHPAAFPEALARDHIISWSNPGDIVFDPFLGSGTTAKMAQGRDRKCIGIELSSEYCDIAVERLSLPLFDSIPDEPEQPTQAGF